MTDNGDFDQSKILEFMARPEAYEPRPATVERIETHGSIVFLAGSLAYKIKRAVKYAFLDFSTLEKRQEACLNELRINLRTAPQIYLDVVPIRRAEIDDFVLGAGAGAAVEWALRMRRFDQEGLYDRMAAEGRLPLTAMPPLAEAIAAFHDFADRVLTVEQGVAPLEGVICDNETVLAADTDLFPADLAEAFAGRTREAFGALKPFLCARARGGYVRHCHGDLHLRNIVEIDGAPVLFDAIEFDDRLATIDVLYDLAFLLMDLGKRGLGAHANTLLNAYLDRESTTGNLLGLATLPLFLSLRAMIRAKVELLRADRTEGPEANHARAEAHEYFLLALDFLTLRQPRLIAIGGLSGSGKSALSRALAPHVGLFPGAVQVRSDVERKRLFGVSLHERLPERAYTSDVSRQVYATCLKRARLALEAGHSVIVDAVQAMPEERAAIEALAAARPVSFAGIWLKAPAEVMRNRVVGRQGDVSDATPSVVDTQLGYVLGAMSFQPVDADRPLTDVVAACRQLIEATG
ncbi:MAG: AAA family ATPase [Methyloceanibacter sp.]